MSKQLFINELEIHLGPGIWSDSRFTDPPESLDSILRLDEQTLEALNLTYDDIVDSLSEMSESDFVDDSEWWPDDEILTGFDFPLDNETPYS